MVDCHGHPLFMTKGERPDRKSIRQIVRSSSRIKYKSKMRSNTITKTLVLECYIYSESINL